MLNEHLLHGFHRKIGIDGLAADLVEGVEALDKCRIGAVLLLDLVLHGSGNLRYVNLEFLYCVFPLLDVRRPVGEKDVEEFDKIPGIANVFVCALTDTMLEENGTFGRLEDDVGFRIALFELGADFFVQIVVLVLGFPLTACQLEGIQ